MESKRKILIIVGIILVIVVGIVIISKTGKKENEVVNNLTQEQAIDIVIGQVKEKLEAGGLILQENGSARASSIGTQGVTYTIYENNEEQYQAEDSESGNTIEVYKIGADIIKRIRKELKNEEITIDGENYFKYGNALIKQSENENINKKNKFRYYHYHSSSS